MKRSIILGGLVGIAIGAIITFAIARGVLVVPAGDSDVAPPAADRSDVDDLAPAEGEHARSAAAVVRPLRPGGRRFGDPGQRTQS